MSPPRPHLAAPPLRHRSRVGFGALAVAAAVIAGSLTPTAPDARAGSAPGQGSASARAAQATTGSITVVTSGGLLSSLVAPVNSALAVPLTQLPGRLSAALAAGLTGAGLQASSGTTRQPRPTSGYPTCGQRGWSATNCYGPLVPAVSAPPLAVLGTGTVQGYATGDGAGWVAASRAANLQLQLLGITLGDLGVADARATCTTTTCTADRSLTGGSLFGGALTVSVANGSTLAKVGNTVVGSTALPVVPGVTATLNQNLLTVKIDLGLTQLLTLLGTTLSALGSLLGGTTTDTGTTATLVVTLGPGAVVSNNGGQSSAWGLAVGVGLTASLNLGVSGLLGLLGGLTSVGVTVGGTQPNLASLQLAYATATAGGLAPGYVPVTVI
ncbi:hypothetical protein [Jatrophihabitans fulvus]